MESIGETLREARHNKRASLEDASRATRIKIDILEQLEADEFDRLAAPTYTKGFLKLYAEYLGLDSHSVVEAYLRSQGGLRRQGLHMETEKTIRARKPHELQLPLRSVGLVVLALTVVVFAVVLGKSVFSRHSAPSPAPQASVAQPAPTAQAAAVQPLTVPKADFDAYYQPKARPAPELETTTAIK
jgi:cytoskeletal protein RodZ